MTRPQGLKPVLLLTYADDTILQLLPESSRLEGRVPCAPRLSANPPPYRVLISLFRLVLEQHTLKAAAFRRTCQAALKRKVLLARFSSPAPWCAMCGGSRVASSRPGRERSSS